jgi:transcriptional regulator with PAS, ATPase and Fis domain
MSTHGTTPRALVSQLCETEGTAAVLILAGYASLPMPLDRPRTLVVTNGMEFGRDRANDSWSADLEDPLMSWRHARVNRKPDGEYVVSDLGSTNGTWLDGRAVPVGVALKLNLGSILMMGGHVFVFRRVAHEDLKAIREDWACPFGPVPTLSPTMSIMVRKLSRLAPADVDVLLGGETGVGKGVHAEAIHKASGRKGPFITINCAAIPENLVESELFGYARGAHSTADRGKPGLIEQAQGGTLFLDEIGEMSQIAQTKLLRFLQSREFLTLGTTQPRRLDVRVVAATNRPVGPDTPETEGLRYDLTARLGPEPLTLLPLRDRPEDIGILTSFLVKDPVTFVPEAYQALFLHNWRGNVRELEKVVTLARVLAGAGVAIGLEHLPAPVAARIDTTPVKTAVQRKQRPTREELETLLIRHGGDVAQLAREIGRQRTLVWRWLRKNQLRPDNFRS